MKSLENGKKVKNKIYACVIFYNDGIEMLKRCFESCKKAGLPIIAIDGKFREFEGPSFSNKEHDNFMFDWGKNRKDDILITGFEYKDQMEKRNEYLSICKKFDADYCLVIDADEELINGDKMDWDSLTEDTYMTAMTDSQNTNWYLHTIRIHKIYPDLEYRNRHSFLYRTDQIADPNDLNSGLKKREFKDMYASNRNGDSLIIKHYAAERSKVRKQQDQDYVNVRTESRNNCNIGYDENTIDKSDTREVTLECTAPDGYNGRTFGFENGEIGTVPYWKYIKLINDFSPLWFKLLKIEELEHA